MLTPRATIRPLDAVTIGQIAAGEVVERPASVVKELVENALDAGATRISVAIRRGGLDGIDVVDDGAGIAPEELVTAFARHATSKLRDADDLFRIATLGFRGEGLASIAAVARVRLVSRTSRDEIAYEVRAHALDAGEPVPVAAPPGTRVEVRELFSNVPVRREFLRAAAAESARVSGLLATLALAYPAVGFSLASDDRTAFAFPAAERLDQRLAHVFGPEPARALIGFESAAVRGYVSRPGHERGDRRMQLLFINGRLLRPALLAGCWNAAYATYAMGGRHPFGVLFVQVAPGDLDANVHPTKSEVRLRRPSEVHDTVRRALASALSDDAVRRMRGALSLGPAASPLPSDGLVAGTASLPEAPALAEPFAFARERSGLRVLAQLDDTFILATDGEALVLVDQHAAHERIAYEEIVARANGRAVASAPLLIPQTIELSALDAARLEGAREALATAGYVIEPFGERAFRIVATPAGYGARAIDLPGLLADLGEEIRGLSQQERVYATLACHSVVRAGDRLEHEEIRALIDRLERCGNPMHCPHGRPTIVRIEAEAIARMFKRPV